MANFSFDDSAENLQQSEVLALYEAVGWSAYTKKPKALMEAIRLSTSVITARSDKRLIGLLRSLSDVRAVNYIQDIIVDPAFQRHGIGRALVERSIKHFPNVRTHILLTDDEERQHSFYRSLGFKDVSTLEKMPLHAFVRMPGIDLE